MLSWKMWDISFAIHPSFWIWNAIFGFILYQPIAGRNAGGDLLTKELLILIAIWVGCNFLTVIVHEMGHAFTGRVMGQPGEVTLSGLGGQAVGAYLELSPKQRLLVTFMGPGAGFLFAFFLVAVDGSVWNWCMNWFGTPFWMSLKCNWYLIDFINPDLHKGHIEDRINEFHIYTIGMMLLFTINLINNIMNLLPIIPMDGGMLFKEVCVMIWPTAGLKIAFGFSFLLAAGCTIYMLLYVLVKYRVLSKPELWYPFALPEFSLIIFGSLAFQCLAAYQKLSEGERHNEYMQKEE